MANLRCYFLLLVVSCSAVIGESVKGMDSETIPVPPKTTVQPSTPDITYTEPPATTSSGETEPTSATELPTTQPPAPTTQPPAPPSPPTPPAPPTPPPTPSPPVPPTTGSWAFSNSTTNISCIVLQLAAQFNVTYPTKDGKQAFAVFNLPNDSQVTDGLCGDKQQWFVLSWVNNSITFTFQRNDTSHRYALSSINLTLQPNETIFPNIDTDVSMALQNSSAEWGTALATSYRCAAPPALQLRAASPASPSPSPASPSAALRLSHLQAEAFRTERGQRFSSAWDCADTDVPDVVPIAVGCALAGLVLVVLAAYLLGRRRSQARGYLSM